MTAACTETQFLRDVAAHEMTVLRDDGVTRHIRFKEPGTINQYFDLITWPGHLCYTGDMGTYVFQRTTDMFEFFRTDREHQPDPSKLKINLSYWTEKLVAVDGNRGGGKVKVFDEEKFKRVINKYRVGWVRNAKEDGGLDRDGRRELWEAVEDEVLGMLEEGEHRATYAAYDFRHVADRLDPDSSWWHFDDLFEHDFTEYTHSIIWCCYALAWGIEKYDAAKQPAAEAVPA